MSEEKKAWEDYPDGERHFDLFVALLGGYRAHYGMEGHDDPNGYVKRALYEAHVALALWKNDMKE